VNRIVKRLAPLSFAKVAGVLYVLLGLLFGGLISVFSILGAGLGMAGDEGQIPGMLLGAGAVVVLPIFYGGLGFITTLLGAVLYNAIASVVGGVEIEVQQGPGLP
jgi:hypothetical protein